jgi:hypothetical protein
MHHYELKIWASNNTAIPTRGGRLWSNGHSWRFWTSNANGAWMFSNDTNLRMFLFVANARARCSDNFEPQMQMLLQMSYMFSWGTPNIGMSCCLCICLFLGNFSLADGFFLWIVGICCITLVQNVPVFLLVFDPSWDGMLQWCCNSVNYLLRGWGFDARIRRTRFHVLLTSDIWGIGQFYSQIVWMTLATTI